MNNLIPDHERRIMLECIPNTIKDPDKVIQDILYRVYMELCMDPVRRDNKPRQYTSEGWNQWIETETYLSLERDGTLGTPAEKWNEQRIQIIRAATARGLEVLRSWGMQIFRGYPEIESAYENIRSSLQEWLQTL